MTNLDSWLLFLRDEAKILGGVPKRSLLVIARSARDRHDPEMLFTARVP